jgi:hypothetical protein
VVQRQKKTPGIVRPARTFPGVTEISVEHVDNAVHPLWR